MNLWQKQLQEGQVIPACPLALHEDGSWSKHHQRALVRYYVDAGAGGLAVGVHTTQFAIRHPNHDLLEPLLRLVSDSIDEVSPNDRGFVKIAGVCGLTSQAIAEAQTAVDCGFHAGLLSLSALKKCSEDELLEHCRKVAEIIPVFGFYLQPDVGGLPLSYSFWRQFAEIRNVVAIKIAPFDRYRTIDVVRAVIESERDDIALYTGNDDNIIADLMTPFRYHGKTRLIVGGLLGQWAVWTKAAVRVLNEIKTVRGESTNISADWLSLNAELTDANGALFDAANDYAGCIPGIHDVLYRRGLIPSRRCLDPSEVLSPGQLEEISRVENAYPNLTDDEFVAGNLARWLNDTSGD